jgi:hypothetical protein
MASKAISAMYLRYFMVNLPFIPARRFVLDSPEPEALQLFLLKAPTRLNSDGLGKLRQEEWLISAILR